jgi:hypothetical protein
MQNFIKALSLFLILFNSIGFSQIKIDKNKKLIVITLEENQPFVEKLTKKNKDENLIVYKNIISTYNNSIKELVEKHLPIFSATEYITLTKFNELEVAKQLKNIYIIRYNIAYNMQLTNLNDDGVTLINPSLDKVKNLDSTNVLDFSIIELGEYDVKGKEYNIIIEKNLYGLQISKGELIYAISQIGKECKGTQNTSEKNKEISSKTLIVNTDYLDKKASESEIAKVYPHKFKIVSNYEFQKQLQNQDGTNLYLMVVPMIKNVMPMGPVFKSSIAYYHIIYDPLNFNSFIVSSPKGMIGMSDINEKISIKQFKSFIEK